MEMYDCLHCGAKLGEQPNGFAALVTRFPKDLLGCGALLEGGPGAVICPRCEKINSLAVPSLVLGPDNCGIIGLPGQIPRVDFPDELLRRVAAKAGARQVTIAVSAREFRRAFIVSHIAPAGDLLNRFMIADNRLSWVNDHELQLDDRFFSAMWLVCAGAVPVFAAPADLQALPTSSFVPHEQAPDAAAHIARRQEALQQQKLNLGALVGYLLLLWAGRTLEAQSLQPFTGKVAALVPAGTLDQPVLEAAADEIGRILNRIDINQPGAITNTYVCDAVLALLALEHGLENPRKHEWTSIVLFYDFMRRRDGNDERILLEPGQVRASVDQPLFWRTCRKIANKFDLVKIHPENANEFAMLYDSAARVFPEEARAQMPLSVAVSSDDKIVENSVRRILSSLKEGNDLMAAAVLNGMRTRHPSELPSVALALLAEVEKNPTLAVERRCELLRTLIEMLNLTGHHAEARAVVSEAVRFIESPEAAEIPVAQQVHLFNEIANRMRYDDDRVGALAIYEHVLDLTGSDVHQKNNRVVLRNRAIVLRELHRYSEARAAFSELMPHAGTSEARGLVTSQAACLQEMGLDAEALALIESQSGLVEGMNTGSDGVIEQVTLHASLLVQQGQVERARRMLDEIRDAAQHRNLAATTMVDHVVTLRNDRDSAAMDKGRAIDALNETFTNLHPGQPLTRIVLDAIAELDIAMAAVGRQKEAERLIRALCKGIDPATTPAGWKLHLLAARHAVQANDAAREGDDLLAALTHFEFGLWSIAAHDDVAAFTSPHAEVTMALVRQIVQRYEQGNDPSGQLVRYAADMRAAPVLSSRLRHSAGLPPPLAEMAAEEERLRQLLKQTPAVLVQFVDIGDSVLAVRSWLNAGGAIESTVRRLGIGGDAFAGFASRLGFALLTAHPSAPQLDIGKVRGCGEIVAALRAATNDLPEGLPMMIVAGPLREPVISLALGNACPICFVPSVSALISMRKRHDANVAADEPGRRRLFAFAAWFDRERKEEAQALTGGVRSATAIAEQNGLSACSVEDIAATGEQLLAGLAAADVAWVACHGRLRPGAEGVELYVSANGSLPPADVSSIRENLREPHVMRWARLAAMARAPGAVFSSACDSGLAFTNPGGERLGIERPLFIAGTLMFIAPMWPVPTVAAQRILTAILDAWLKNPEVALAQHVWRVRNDSVAAGDPALASAAFAPFGDALTTMQAAFGGRNGPGSLSKGLDEKGSVT